MDLSNTGSSLASSSGDTRSSDASAASVLSSLLQGSGPSSSDAQLAVLRALYPQQSSFASAPTAPTSAPVQRGVSRSNSGALSLPSSSNDATLRALLRLQAAQQPAAVTPAAQLADLLRGGLLSTATPAPPAALSSSDVLSLRINALLSTPARSSTDLLDQARILQAYTTHQQALATANEAERRLNELLQGGSAAIQAPQPSAAAEVAPTAVARAAVAPFTTTSAGLSESDARKLNTLDTLQNPKQQCQPCLPPIEEGNTPHYSQRVIVPLGMEEDPNWLSERQCFIRSELLEVVRASHEEVLVRSSSKSIAYQQVGIRCRYCAHLPAGSRAIRASAFPSSIRQMYQSFTMMVRDHFGHCVGVPKDKKQRFLKLKGLTSPSSSLSRQYWTFAAKKLGMIDSEFGIMINEESQAAAAKIPPFGTSAQETKDIQAAQEELMVCERDQNGISAYLFFLLSQAQVVHLLPSERVGKRKDAAVGLPGFGCKYCAKSGRLGFCRMFPLNKRSLPDKVNDLYNHMMRCPNCPPMTKRVLEGRRTEQETNRTFAERDRDYIDRIWIKLGRDCDEAFKKS